ncbi:MAG TPA: hypothetical protein VNX29_02255 [Kaistia sp.]|nr:hypothetical protein [Kaistia sp.]
MTSKDHSTFTTKAQREQEHDLRSKYGELGNPELVAAIRQQQKSGKTAAKTAHKSEQMQMAIAAREQD